MENKKILNAALIGGGMFGSDVVLRSIEDIERCGIAPYLGRIGLDERARALGDVSLKLVAIGTRTAETAETLCASYSEKIPGAAPAPVHGEPPGVDRVGNPEVDSLRRDAGSPSPRPDTPRA